MTVERDQESHLPVHDGMVGAGVPFQRIRRITGYLMTRWEIFKHNCWQALVSIDQALHNLGGAMWAGLARSLSSYLPDRRGQMRH